MNTIRLGVPARERFGDDTPELYCQGCLIKFGLKVPAVFARRNDSVHYAVVCPVAGLHTHDSGYLSHGGPHGEATGADGHRYQLQPNGELTSIKTTQVNGRKRGRLTQLSALVSRKWMIATADTPMMGNATHAPESARVVDDFDWDWFAEQQLKGRLE